MIMTMTDSLANASWAVTDSHRRWDTRWTEAENSFESGRRERETFPIAREWERDTFAGVGLGIWLAKPSAGGDPGTITQRYS